MAQPLLRPDGDDSHSPIVDPTLWDALERECSHFEQYALETADGTTLRLYECGPAEAPPLLIVNPIGVPVLIAARLARALAQYYRVITWEQRGTSCTTEEFFRRPHRFDAFVGDLIDIHTARAYGAACPLIGICSGAALIVRAAAKRMLPCAPAVLINPMLPRVRDYSPSQFEITVVPYLRAIAAGNNAIATQLLQLGRSDASIPGLSDDMRLIQAADKASMRSPSSLTIYAAVVDSFTGQSFDEDIRMIGGEDVRIISALNDKMVSTESVRSLARLLPRASLREYDRFGHHSIFLDDRVRSDIADDLAVGGAL